MSIKEIDFLSPKITLFYYGSKRHKSFVGAIITLIMVMLSALYVFYLIMNIIKHKSSNFMSYKTYLTDAGHYIFNDTTGIYHYFQIYDIENKVFGQYNSKYIRIFMSRLYRSYQNNQSLLSDYYAVIITRIQSKKEALSDLLTSQAYTTLNIF